MIGRPRANHYRQLLGPVHGPWRGGRSRTMVKRCRRRNAVLADLGVTRTHSRPRVSN